MEEYLSERQQLDWLWGVVKENAPWALASVLLTVAGFAGYAKYQSWREGQATVASQKYESTLEALSRGDADSARRIVGELRTGYGRTAYADSAALALARFEVDSGHLSAAAELLETVTKNTHDEDLAVVTRLRLARVQRADGKPDAALATLAAATAGADAPAFADVRGDVLADKGDKNGALAAWRQALASKSAGVNRELIELKIAALDPGAAAAAPAGQAP